MGILNILKTAKAITDFASDNKTVEALSNFKKLGTEISEKFIDTDNDGDFDMDDFNTLYELSGVYASIIGHVATLDHEEAQETELDVGLEIINKICFSENGFLNEDIIAFSRKSKKEIRNSVFEKIEHPFSLKKISKKAIEMETEEEFYEIACSVVLADNEVSENEREFLDHFAKELSLSKFDVKVIEKKFK